MYVCMYASLVRQTFTQTRSEKGHCEVENIGFIITMLTAASMTYLFYLAIGFGKMERTPKYYIRFDILTTN